MNDNAVDLQSLLDRVGGDRVFVKDLVGGFITRCPSMLAEIRDALQRGDLEHLPAAAHHLSGSAAEYGAHEVLAITRELERLGRSGDMGGAQKLLPALEGAVAHMLTVLETFRDSPDD